MSPSIEQVQPGDWDGVERIRRALESVVDTSGLSVGIRFGTSTVTWGGGTPFATVTAAHGLGRTPTVVFAGDAGGGTMVANIPVWSAQTGVSVVTVSAETSDASSPALGLTRTFYWVAIG